MKNKIIFISLTLLIFSGCGTTYKTRVNDTPSGIATVYEDTHSTGAVAGIGIESQDITSMTDRMMRDMLSSPILANRSVAPRVIVDDKYFKNESSSIINKRLITERLMINLNRAASGRMIFVERGGGASEMVEEERTLKRQGVVSQGTMGNTAYAAGADFRLTGRIMSHDGASASSGKTSRYHMITFKMVDLETGIAAWTNMYEFRKAAQDDIIYR